MSKKIINVIQMDSGGDNPKSGLFEQPLWQLHFEDDTTRILGKVKMEEYLSKAFDKMVHHFKKKYFTMKDDKKITFWNVILIDYEDVSLSPNQFRDKLYLGHQRKDEEKYKELEAKLEEKKAPQSEILFHPQTTPSTTTPSEREELDKFRKKVIEEATNEAENPHILKGEY